MARHRPQTGHHCGADLVGIVSVVLLSTELLHYCAKTNFAGPTKSPLRTGFIPKFRLPSGGPARRGHHEPVSLHASTGKTPTREVA
jgi:hypothetical protein